jgi:hypothetical protein
MKTRRTNPNCPSPRTRRAGLTRLKRSSNQWRRTKPTGAKKTRRTKPAGRCYPRAARGAAKRATASAKRSHYRETLVGSRDLAKLSDYAEFFAKRTHRRKSLVRCDASGIAADTGESEETSHIANLEIRDQRSQFWYDVPVPHVTYYDRIGTRNCQDRSIVPMRELADRGSERGRHGLGANLGLASCVTRNI